MFDTMPGIKVPLNRKEREPAMKKSRIPNNHRHRTLTIPRIVALTATLTVLAVTSTLASPLSPAHSPVGLRGALVEPSRGRGDNNTATVDGVHYFGGRLPDPGDVPSIELYPQESNAALRSSVDLSGELPPVGNQGNQQSCAAWATGYYCKTWAEGKKHPGWDLSQPGYQFSPSFIYNQVNNGMDQGASFQGAYLLMEARGCTDLKEMPYDEKDYETQPTNRQLEAAMPYRISRDWGAFWVNDQPTPYDPPNDIEPARAWLNSGKPLVFCIPIFWDFPGIGANPPSPYYDYNETAGQITGHYVCACGYDDNANPAGADPDHRGGFKIVNSWGPWWNGASRGYLYLSYDFVKRYAWAACASRDDTSSSPYISYLEPASGQPGDTVDIHGDNFGVDRRESCVTFGGKVADVVSWSNQRIEAVVPETSGTHESYVYNWDREKSNGATFSTPSADWYLAEGSTAHGFDTHITIENPNYQPVTADITFMKSDGTTCKEAAIIQDRSLVTIRPRDFIGEADFSTSISCKDGKSLSVDRTTSWVPEDSSSIGGHNSIGATRTSKTWYLPEGSSRWGFESWILIQNPNEVEATADLKFMTEGDGQMSRIKKIPANSRASFSMADEIGAADASVEVVSDVPLVVERSMYRYSRREGHNSIGATEPSDEFYLAEGSTAHGFDCYLLIQNPADGENNVTITLMDSSGGEVQETCRLAAESRRTMRLSEIAPCRDVSVHVTGSLPLVAERAMYWGKGTASGEACHDSIGVAAPHRTWYLPDCRAGDEHKTWTLVMNPDNTGVTVKISYLVLLGDNLSLVDTIPAHSRRTYDMSDHVATGEASIEVSCLTAEKKIVVERSTYWNSSGAGVNSIGGFSD